jgi:hypothetical protein
VNLARSAAEAKLFMAAIPLGLALLDPKDLASAATDGGFDQRTSAWASR